MSGLCEQLGAALTVSGDLEAAQTCLNDAINTTPHNTAALYSMAELFKIKGDDEKVESLCTKIISADPAHEAATVMLSDSLFAKHPDSGEAVNRCNLYSKLYPITIEH